MFCLAGASALSEFRRERLLSGIRERAAEGVTVRSLEASYRYYLDADPGALDERERLRLCTLLDAEWPDGPSPLTSRGERGPVPGVEADGVAGADRLPLELFVVPRPGTRSPWSSKASDILHACGLGTVRRVERGVRYRLDLSPDDGASASGSPAAGEVGPATGSLAALLHDRMIEVVLADEREAVRLFETGSPRPLETIDVTGGGIAALAEADVRLGLALSDGELDYLVTSFRTLDRDPTDVELMMFAQANSEHCRHKIFNADWTLDGEPSERSLFAMIRNTHAAAPDGVLSAYHDNAAVIEGGEVDRWLLDGDGHWRAHRERAHVQIKVETHNHPTAISPFPGAATGAGGEIRDEGATGNGAHPKAGLCGFAVSNLEIPTLAQPWEKPIGRPARIASALEIMRDGPIGAAAFNNEFGRPNLGGCFRTFCQPVALPDGEEWRGFHKPLMIAGGLGNIRPGNIAKRPLPPGAAIIVLGGPAMQIGLGGGAASSVASGTGEAELDFASVQRGNPEMERRCQEVIDRCVALGEDSPILSLHDVGAGGLSNAVPELVGDAGRGGRFELREVPSDEPGMSPMAIWSNESQERYVLALDAGRLERFDRICARERCPYAVLGEATEEKTLVVTDRLLPGTPVEMPLEVLFGRPPKLQIDTRRRAFSATPFGTGELALEDVVPLVLQLPGVAAKQFLITIGDRTVSGLVARDQMVGPWQVAVADVAVTLADYRGYRGEAMAMGERPPLALVDPVASARMALGEALTNIAAANIGAIGRVKLSANWMAAAGHPGEDGALHDAVEAIGMELAPALGIAIPVGKDSLSMKTVWREREGDSSGECGGERSVTAPLSLVVTAFAPVEDARLTLTPALRSDCGETELVLVDLGAGRNRMGGSALAQVHAAIGDVAPDVDEPALLKGLFEALQALIEAGLVLAWHDRSDGGLFVTLAEMGFAGNTGLRIRLDSLPPDPVATLFNEELGGVLQIRSSACAEVLAVFERHGLGEHVHAIGSPVRRSDDGAEGRGGEAADALLEFRRGSETLYAAPLAELKGLWWSTTHAMQRLRDNPDCADAERAQALRADDPGLSPYLAFDVDVSPLAGAAALATTRPKVAILREQGVNGHAEMAAAFDMAGFDPIDVHMSDLAAGSRVLDECRGLAACGGFSYGDVLGAGGGWARSILFTERLLDTFSGWFAREDTFSLGVCNGCQMMAQLADIIPGAANWPRFERNLSEQFEARLSTVIVHESPSILLTDMAGSRLPVAVAHGEGRAVFADEAQMRRAKVAIGYVDNAGAMTEDYPLNPNGSPHGITGLCSEDGRVTILMPHPERVVRTVCHSWHPPKWGERGPWRRLFENARVWAG